MATFKRRSDGATKSRRDEETERRRDEVEPFVASSLRRSVASQSLRNRWLVSLLFVAPLTLEAFALLLRYAFDCWLIQPWHLLLLPAFSVSAALTLGVLAFFSVARTVARSVARTSGTCSSIPDAPPLRQAGGDSPPSLRLSVSSSLSSERSP